MRPNFLMTEMCWKSWGPAGAALYIAGKADTIEGGVRLAEQIIDEGLAEKKLEEFVRLSNEE